MTSITTPGASVDVVVTEYGIAINPQRRDLISYISKIPDIPLYSINELAEKAVDIVGEAQLPEYFNRPVGLVEYRDGTLIDVINQVKI